MKRETVEVERFAGDREEVMERMRDGESDDGEDDCDFDDDSDSDDDDDDDDDDVSSSDLIRTKSVRLMYAGDETICWT